MLYRWEDDGEIQLNGVIGKIQWKKYNTRILCGFSAGCNEILKTLLNTDIKCERIILQSPWIPMIDGCLHALLNALSNVSIEIICGENDDDCLPYAKKLAEEAIKLGLDCNLQIVIGRGHIFLSE